MDVGGTLRSNTFTLTPALRDERTSALRSLLGLSAARAGSVIEEIDKELDMSPEDNADGVIARVLKEQGSEDQAVTAAQVRHALCVELGGVLPPFHHAGELLAGIKALGLCCVVLSNTVLRDAEMYLRDFTALGWRPWVDDYVTSVDVGFSKPDERIFASALDLAAAPPTHCVMVGNSEQADIAPAIRLGMRTVLVAIEDPVPTTTAADACVTGLDQALQVIRGWVATR